LKIINFFHKEQFPSENAEKGKSRPQTKSVHVTRVSRLGSHTAPYILTGSPSIDNVFRRMSLKLLFGIVIDYPVTKLTDQKFVEIIKRNDEYFFLNGLLKTLF
jgi:hypothetical protein